MKIRKRFILLTITFLLLVSAFFFHEYGRSIWYPVYLRIKGKRTVSDVIAEIDSAADARIKFYFSKAEVIYPPRQLALLIFKMERTVELWAEEKGRWVFIRSYPILGASGKGGPKLREGDWQVPEGIYKVIALNPNSSYHLSMKINYPNEYDRQKAVGDNRTNLGDDIFIHGKRASIGCVAIGDEAIEELFVLADKVGLPNVEVVISPNDIRKALPLIEESPQILWLNELYGLIGEELKKFKN